MRSLALACVSALAALTLCAGAQASPPAIAVPKLPLGHAGRWITDARGRVVIVHGINMVYKVAPYYPAAAGFGNADAAFLARMGFSAVRVGVIWKAVEPEPGVYDNGYLDHIAATVKTLARHGIVSLLDFHQDMYNELFQGEGAPDWAVEDDGLPPVPKSGFPGNYLGMPALEQAFDHFWANSLGPGGIGLEDRYAAAWHHVALRFRGQRSVLGYELFNEPWPGTGYATCLTAGGCPAFDATLTAFNRKVDAAIRTADRRTLVWYEPNVLFDFGAPTNVGALDDPRAGFSWHDYCLTAGSCSTNGTAMTNAAQHVAKTGEATMLTEFGATNDVATLESVVRLADQNMVPWLEWAYCGCQDPTTSGPGDEQAIVRNPAQAPRGSNVVMPTLRALVEPYPQLVSGTPLSWAFDPTSRVFTLRFTTARARGRGRFGAGAVTAVATQPLVYGGRYAVRVKGGAIISRRGAPLLRIASCRRARAITVTVTPSGRNHESCRPPLRAR